jgi:hypothetical protein
MKRPALTTFVLAACSAGVMLAQSAAPPAVERQAIPPVAAAEVVRPIAGPLMPLPPEEATSRLEQVSLIVYGDTRGGPTDGITEHPIHAELMDQMLDVIRVRANTDRAIRFVLQTGDAVLRGNDAHMWNVSYTPIIERLTRHAGVPYFLTLGNHDVLPVGRDGGASGRDNSLRAMSNLYPPVGSARRLGDSATFAFGIGGVFVLTIDSNAAADPQQLAWASAQLESLDRRRYKTVVAFLHHAPYTSGPHGVAVEAATLAVRNQWMPLLRRHHVRLLLAGHEHFFERWVERYRDGSRSYRLDIMVTGGGGAPTYSFRGEPDLTAYLAAGAAQQLQVEHLVRPAPTNDGNPNHFVIIDIDDGDVYEEVVALDGRPFTPFDGRAREKMTDSSRLP